MAGSYRWEVGGGSGPTVVPTEAKRRGNAAG
jgi:hypothetical protein